MGTRETKSTWSNDRMNEDPLAADIEWPPDEIPEKGENTWTTFDGRVLLLTEMTDNHLDNAIRYLEVTMRVILEHAEHLLGHQTRPSFEPASFSRSLVNFLRQE
jgi:hypothetical protein